MTVALELSAGQRAVVEHDAVPCRVTGGYGSGVSTALRARAERLRSEGRRPLLLRHDELGAFCIDLLRRHGRPVSLLPVAEQVALIATIVDEPLRSMASEVAATLNGFQSSFLGAEELRVHAHAAGMLGEAESVIALTARYLDLLERRNRVDAAGAIVGASLLLRDHGVLAVERRRFDELIVDDFQLASFATHRVVTQLAGRDGPVTVGGNADAAVADDPLASAHHLERFDRRFGCRLVVHLDASHRAPGVPTLRLEDDDDAARTAVAAAVEQAGGMGIGREDTAVVTRDLASAAVGRSWSLVVVPDATEGRWPAPRPVDRWFDRELFHGPDLPSDDERDERWLALERRRFGVATSRADRFLVVVACLPASRFVGDLIR